MNELDKGMGQGISDTEAPSQWKALKNLGTLISTEHCKATRNTLESLKPHGVEFGLHFAGKITSVGAEGGGRRGK